MWIFTSNAFLSVVADRDNPDRLLVRARVPGHIERVFPDAKVFTDSQADYLYRAFIQREVVVQAVAANISKIDYDNFKDSVNDPVLHNAYMNVWGVMEKIQA